MNILKALKSVETHGTTLDNYRLFFLLAKGKNDEIPLPHFRNLQNKDGGFPYNDEKGKVSCVNNTGNNLSLMIELGLNKSDVCRKTVRYLFKIQAEDGSWSENKAIRQYDPPFWDLPINLGTTMWLTAHIANLIMQLDYRNSPAIKSATTFLLKNREKDGKFAGFLHSTWIAIGVFGQLEGSKSDIVKKTLTVIEQNFEKISNSAGDLAWCLECFYVAGLPKENRLVKKSVNALVNLQEENGTWKSGDGEEYTVTTTINALNVLKKYKAW